MLLSKVWMLKKQEFVSLFENLNLRFKWVGIAFFRFSRVNAWIDVTICYIIAALTKRSWTVKHINKYKSKKINNEQIAIYKFNLRSIWLCISINISFFPTQIILCCSWRNIPRNITSWLSLSNIVRPTIRTKIMNASEEKNHQGEQYNKWNDCNP